MLTITGELVLPTNDVAPSLEAVGVSLAGKPRWSRQTLRPMNVLAHSFMVADLADPDVRADCLLHDAGEILADVPTPWKTVADRQREHEIKRRIYRDLSRRWPLSEHVAAEVKWADMVALRLEATLIMPPEIETIDDGAVPLVRSGDILISAWGAICKADDLLTVGARWIGLADDPRLWSTAHSPMVQRFVRECRAGGKVE